MAQTPVSGPGSESLRKITEAKTVGLDHFGMSLSTKNYSQLEPLEHQNGGSLARTTQLECPTTGASPRTGIGARRSRRFNVLTEWRVPFEFDALAESHAEAA